MLFKATEDSLPESIDSALNRLKGNVQKWRDLPNAERAKVARACRAKFATLDMAWVEDNMRCLGIEPSQRDAYNTIGFDPFMFIASTAGRLDKVAEFYEGKIQKPQAERQVSNGPSVYQMGEVGKSAGGCTLEVWDGGEPPSESEVNGASLVLGAGNQNFLTAIDVIERAFIHKECVFLKHHPIRPFMEAPFREIFAPLAEAGAYAQCTDLNVGKAHTALSTHPAVEHIHMTGSGATHDRIIASLKAAGREKVEFTSELGCVTPWIICPGTTQGAWTPAAIQHHACMLSSAFKSSCSMNCCSPKVLVLPKETIWPERQQFLTALRQQLQEKPQPAPYYPGAQKRWNDFAKEYPDAEKIESRPVQQAQIRAQYPGQDLTLLPSLLVDVGTVAPLHQKKDAKLGADSSCRPYAIQNEAFSPVLAIMTVDCDSIADFGSAAACVVNESVFGTLSCTLIYPDPPDAKLDAIIKDLRYGTVAVNLWSALSYSNPLSVWGGFPGSYSRDKPESGLDFVGNFSGVPNPSKCVVRSAFVNKEVSMSKPMPLVIADSLTVVVSGQTRPKAKIACILCSRVGGLLPRRMPKYRELTEG